MLWKIYVCARTLVRQLPDLPDRLLRPCDVTALYSERLCTKHYATGLDHRGQGQRTRHKMWPRAASRSRRGRGLEESTSLQNTDETMRTLRIAGGSVNDEMLYATVGVPRVAGPASMKPASAFDRVSLVPVDCRAAGVAVAVVEALGDGCRTRRHSSVQTRV